MLIASASFPSFPCTFSIEYLPHTQVILIYLLHLVFVTVQWCVGYSGQGCSFLSQLGKPRENLAKGNNMPKSSQATREVAAARQIQPNMCQQQAKST